MRSPAVRYKGQRRGLQAKLAEGEAWAGHGGSRNAVTCVDKVRDPKGPWLPGTKSSPYADSMGHLPF
jgi:hypothetical protein